MQIEIPDVIYSFITESLGKDVSDTLVEAFLTSLDREDRIRVYIKLSKGQRRRNLLESFILSI